MNRYAMNQDEMEKAVQEEWDKVRRFFTEGELERLQEVA